MTQSVITTAFETYLVDQLQASQPVVLDEIVLAYFPGLDLQQPIDRATGMPAVGNIVHRQDVDQVGRVNQNAVVYSIVMDTTIGDFTFNAIYLINKATEMVAMIVYKEDEQKLATAGATQGNSLVKSMLMEYDGAATATQVNVDAGTWQIDYAARLRGIDDDIRQRSQDHYGTAAFLDTSFAVTAAGVNQYSVAAGRAYVAGLRAIISQAQTVTVDTKPATIYLDVCHTGTLLTDYQTSATLTVSTVALTDYVDGGGEQHYVAPIASIAADGSITDLRGRGGLWWHENRPTAHTKAQVGLGNVDNNPTASQAEAEAGAASDRFMSPLRVKQAIAALHGNRTDNPHGVTKAQVGLGSVDNYPTATQAEAEAGTAANRFMTPQRVKQALDKLVPPPFPPGTRMLFQQSAAPTGWVKETTNYNNHALRVVTGNVGSGGDMDFTSAFSSWRTDSWVNDHSHGIYVNNHTLTLDQIPWHTHPLPRDRMADGSGDMASLSYTDNTDETWSNDPASGGAGGSQGHNHGAGSYGAGGHSHGMSINVKYVDIIIATKQ